MHKDKHHMQSDMWHDMAIIILCLWSPSPKHRHDHHRHRLDTMISIVASWSSHRLLLLQLSLAHSYKAKQLHGVCISYNKATTIRLLPVANNLYKTWSSHTTHYITSCLDHITSQHALQNQVRRTLLCCCKFYVASTGWARTVLTYASKTTMRYSYCFLIFIKNPVHWIRFNFSWLNWHPPANCVRSMSVEPVLRKRMRNVGLGRFIQQYRRIKKQLVTGSNMYIPTPTTPFVF